MSLLSQRDRPGVAGDLSDPEVDPAAERVALKDRHLVYRACSMAFAEAIGQGSPSDVIGRRDTDLFAAAVARDQLALDSRVMHSGQADIGSIDLSDEGAQPSHAMVVRTPVLTPDGEVRGIDLRLLGGAPVASMRSAVTVDYRTLINEGLQGSLIVSGQEILFADARATRLLGFDPSMRLTDHGQAGDLFNDAERARLEAAALAGGQDLGSQDLLTVIARGHDAAPYRLLARVTAVQWGVRRATLLSFIDAAAVVPVLSTPVATAAPEGPVALGRVMPPVATDGEAEGASGTLAHWIARTRQLEAIANRYRQYARSVADFFWELDEELRFRRVSPELERVFGVSAEDLNGRTHHQLAEHSSNAGDGTAWRTVLERVSAHQPFRDVELVWRVGSDTRVIRYSGIPLFGPESRFAGYRGVGCDVTAATRQAQATAYHANHDALTGLANRRHFEALVGDALEAASHDRLKHALCYMDLDSFKPVNDTCGHAAGDELLRQLAQLFDELVRKSDVLARLGGDEFGVFLYDCAVPQALKLANQIRHEVENYQFLWEGKAFQVGVSIGLVVVDDRWESVDSLFSAADAACYIAKNEGRNRVSVYREGEGNASNRKVATHWVEHIQSALDNGRVLLAAQPIQALGPATAGTRFELLMRLELADGTLAAPSAFLPSAERYGLSNALDRRMLELTLAWLESDLQQLDEIRHVSLNLSSATFTDESFADNVLVSLARSPVPAEKLCFEMSETATIANLARASEFMQRLAAIGCRFSIDDFGSGLSSFAWLRKLPVDFLKIDGLLVRDILEDPTDLTMVQAISHISKSLGKRTVAEYVESPRLLAVVRDLGIDFAQGYHLGEPVLIGRH